MGVGVGMGKAVAVGCVVAGGVTGVGVAAPPLHAVKMKTRRLSAAIAAWAVMRAFLMLFMVVFTSLKIANRARGAP